MNVRNTIQGQSKQLARGSRLVFHRVPESIPSDNTNKVRDMETIYGHVQNLGSVAALMHKYNERVCPTPEYAAQTLLSLTRTCVSAEKEFLKVEGNQDKTFRTYTATACGFVMLYSCKPEGYPERYREIRALFDPCGNPSLAGLEHPKMNEPIG